MPVDQHLYLASASFSSLMEAASMAGSSRSKSGTSTVVLGANAPRVDTRHVEPYTAIYRPYIGPIWPFLGHTKAIYRPSIAIYDHK